MLIKFLQFNMLVKYIYRADEGAPSESNEGDDGFKSQSTTQTGQLKKFFFYTLVDLGPIIPRPVEPPSVENLPS